MKRLESILKQFLLFALRQQDWAHRFELPPYEARLGLLHLDSITDRRKLATLNFVFKFLNGVIRVPALNNQLQVAAPVQDTRSASLPRLRLLQMARLAYMQFSPVRKCITLFNSFNKCYKAATNLTGFQREIKQKLFAER